MSALKHELTDPEGQGPKHLMTLDGDPLPTFRLSPEERGANILSLRDWQMKENDVILCTPPKCGTHWVQEIMTMLLKGKPEMVETVDKGGTMMEASSIDRMNELPSPRILNSHLKWQLLPKYISENKNKVVVVLRNPKDVAVSFYYHMKGMNNYDYDGKFEYFLEWFLEGKLPYGCFFESVKEYELLANEQKDQFHTLFYEDLKTNGLQEVKRLAQFLRTNDADDFCQAVYDACDIKNLKAKVAQPKEGRPNIWKPGGSIYRKGIIGDWKSHLTVAQNELFDRVIADKMKDSKIQFRYI
ncbi:sulfotransferase 1B1-like [Mya arenaria]|uniref:sulfotransferase 1B1-like n=1 Tax=Mya arenaria TaxID=6604 RepID=UPI0022DF66B6|nr:sulfotransferase 1B1-like [Mya arenaria]XP_052766500.1 sulfotransferase 1B1-like [Mya arenaria]XP_052766501.1 sulfotransferase 1B1-like [Mya arenaria]XP_052766502.1 sulfotransferase 1B1-like [Mya arenaria]